MVIKNAGLHASCASPGRRPAAFALVVLAAGTLRAGVGEAMAQVAPYYMPGPYERHWLGYPGWPPGAAHGPCYPFASCWAMRDYEHQQRRAQRFDSLRQDGDSDTALIDALPHGPPSPESELQPRYRDSGKVLPQYEHAGEMRPEYRREADNAPPR
jgi:hypothetical protein